MAGHFKEVCEFGLIHKQCRCLGERTVRHVKCDRPEGHRKLMLNTLSSGPSTPTPTPTPVATVEIDGKIMPDPHAVPEDPRKSPFAQPLPGLDEMSDGETLTWMGTDAIRWALVFQHYEGRAASDDDKLMNLVSWFANAIGAGQTDGRAPQLKECECGRVLLYAEKIFPERIDGDPAVVHRDPDREGEDGRCTYKLA